MIDQIFVDLDDVCNHFTIPVLMVYGCNCIDDEDFPTEVGYNIVEACNLLHPTRDDWTETEFWGNLDSDIWDGLPMRDECHPLLNMCAAIVGRQNVFICTRSLPDPKHYSGKMAWIYNNLPQWIYNQVIISGRKETNARPGALLIDDSEENVNRFRMTRGGKAILVPRPWNCLWGYPQHWVECELKLAKGLI